MRRGGRMSYETLGVAELVGDAHELERIEEAERRLLVAVDLEAHQRRAAAHLLLDGRGLRMIAAPRIDGPLDLAVPGERLSDDRRRLGLAAHPQMQRLQPLEQHP